MWLRLLNMAEQQSYVIRVGAHFGEKRAALFGEVKITPLADGHTLISGRFADQSALFGILIRIRDLGLPLISVNPVEKQED
jgi:hypothetical protein